MEFESALTHILASEGGYVNHPNDPGGETRYGITKHTARAHGYKGPMRELPLSVAESIYRKSYWDACRCDELPPGIRLAVFDAAITSGSAQSILWLQRCLEVTANGKVNAATISAASKANPHKLVFCLLDKRLAFVRQLRNWPTFGKGWIIRIEKLRKLAQSSQASPPRGKSENQTVTATTNNFLN